MACSNPGVSRLRLWLAIIVLLTGALPARAVERILNIDAPSTVLAGSPATFTISASTDAGQGEQVGFLQADASVDGGRTWTAVCYLTDVGTTARQTIYVTAGATGSAVQVRVRAAFRHGLAGDVDYTGAAIRWTETWQKWSEPPTRRVVLPVAAK